MPDFKILMTSLAVVIGTTMPTFAQEIRPQDVVLTPVQISTDIALARETYERIHPGYTRYTSQTSLDEAWNSINIKAKSKAGLSLGDFYIEVQNALAQMRCDHTKAELPRIIAKDRNVTPVYLPLVWRVVEGRAIIENPGNTGLAFGDEITSIDGRAIQDMMDEVRPLIPVDGDTGFVRDIHMGTSFELMGGSIDHFGALLWDIKPTAQLGIKSIDGERRMVSVDRVLHKNWKSLVLDGKESSDFPDAVTFNRIGETAAYLRIDSFVNYRNPVKPDTIYDPIFSAIKAEGRDTLILDLRENGGGSTDAKVRLFAHLIAEKDRLVKDTRIKTLDHSGLETHLSTWDKRVLNPKKIGFTKNENGTYSLRKMFSDDLKTVKPDRTAFTGKLFVLTSRSNGSASTALLAKLQDMGRATLIGEETGGSAEGPTAGVLFTLKLPESGIRTRVPVFQDFNAISTFTPNKGVTPDLFAPMTAEAFIKGEDPAYDAALALIDQE